MDSLFALRLLVPAASTDAEAAQHAWQQLQPTMREAASLGVLLAAAAEVGLLGGGRLLLQLRECEGGGQHIATDPRIDRLLGSRSGAKVVSRCCMCVAVAVCARAGVCVAACHF